MPIEPSMHRLQKLDGWGGLDECARNFLPIVVPWILIPSSFSIFAALVHACANNSVQEVLTFVVVPVALLMGFSRSCSSRVYRPTFAPSSVATLITIMAVTHFLQLSYTTTGLHNAIFSSACVTLVVSFLRMIVSNPGRVLPVSNYYVSLAEEQQPFDIENAGLHRSQDRDEHGRPDGYCNTCNVKRPLRSKHCKYCNICVERYDHHCPAIYNCVGRKNHAQFLQMLVVFIVVELLFLQSCITYLRVYHIFEKPQTIEARFQKGALYNDVESIWETILEVLVGDPWVFSTATFAGIQILWQVPLFIFHIYCVCSNLTTDEMFHWETYIGLYVETPPVPALGRPFVGKDFVNPYTKGVKQNLISFLRGQI